MSQITVVIAASPTTTPRRPRAPCLKNLDPTHSAATLSAAMVNPNEATSDHVLTSNSGPGSCQRFRSLPPQTNRVHAANAGTASWA